MQTVEIENRDLLLLDSGRETIDDDSISVVRIEIWNSSYCIVVRVDNSESNSMPQKCEQCACVCECVTGV